MASFALTPTLNMLSGCVGLGDDELTECFDDDFHYFDNNLTNLHFYFINAAIDGKRLKRCKGKEAFMVVKIPQQHITEQLLRENDFTTDFAAYRDGSKVTTSEISGFSYLAFKLFPARPNRKPARYVPLDNLETLLDWNNEKYFELQLPEAIHYTEFAGVNLTDFRAANPVRLLEVAGEDPKSLFYRACRALFKNQSEELYPFTLLEVPRGLLVTPDKSSFPKGTKPVFHPAAIEKHRYLYRSSKGEVVRSVQEIWTAQLWFQQEGRRELTSPPLRAAGYMDLPYKSGERPECPPEDEIYSYLPNYLDREEITYLTSLGRDKGVNNKTQDWAITTEGLTFTGLGAITKLHYKNLRPPNGSSLAEYEHHISLGRDEYVKVARIGVISVTGQRALYVRIGKRVISKGISYMQFHEYVEIVEDQIQYFNPELFIDNQGNDEPANYIHARTHPIDITAIIHSDDQVNREDDNRWNDQILWDLPGYLPGQSTTNTANNWHTHYRRWPFKSITAIEKRTRRIDTSLSTVACNGTCAADNPRVFWPVLEKQELNSSGSPVCKDATLEFSGVDWNNNESRFSSTFLFIRKDVIEEIVAHAPTNCINNIYAAFTGAEFSRRHIDLRNQQVAFSRDYSPKNGQALPNKSNVAETEFLEYFFSICAEPNGVTRDGKDIPYQQVFNERFFPLYPQTKRAQLYLANLPERLPSVIEFHGDYVNYGYEGIATNGQKKQFVKNVARLLFNHTAKFINGTEEPRSFTDKLLQPVEDINRSYQRIKQSFGGAGPAIGGLVNPDFDIQSVALVRQSIAIGRDINKKLEKAENVIDEIKAFNPSDLFRQMPELFNGISIIDILQEVFPEFEAPVNEIKNVVAQIGDLRDEIVNNPVFENVEAAIKTLKQKIIDAIAAIEDLQIKIDEKTAELSALKDRLNFEKQFLEFENLIKSAIDQYRIDFFEYRDEIVSFIADNTVLDKVLDHIASELLSRIETIWPYWQLLRKAREDLENLRGININGTTLSVAGQAIIDAYIAAFFDDRNFAVFDITQADKNAALRTFAEVRAAIKTKIEPCFIAYNTYTNAVKTETSALHAYTRVNTQALFDAYAAAKKVVHDQQKIYQTEIDRYLAGRAGVNTLLEQLSKNIEDAAIVLANENIITEVMRLINSIDQLLESSHIYYYISLYEKAAKEFDIVKSRFKEGLYPKQVIDAAETFLRNEIRTNTVSVRQDLLLHYQLNYDTLKDDVDQLILETAPVLEKYIGISIPATVEKVLAGVQGFPTDIATLKKTIDKATNDLEATLKKQLREKLAEYEKLLREEIEQQTGGIVKRVNDEIDKLERQLLSDPDNLAILQTIADARKLYNIITSISQKEFVNTWQITSFKDANFGPVYFVSSAKPRTTLNVHVRTVAYFQPSKFPAVIDRIEAVAENRLSNFGLSLMKAMTVNFNEVSFIAGTNRPAKFDVKIRDVQFAGALSFVQAFESWLKSLMGDAFRLQLQPTFVNIGYTLPIPDIKTPSFNFFNLTLNFDFFLHFDKKPMQLGFSLARRDSKFGLTAGIYAGFGFFSIVAEPKRGITEMEIGLEFGGYYGLSLGPLRGEVKLVVGLYYKKDASGVVIEGYFLCEGRVKLWFVMITARFYMGVRSQGGYVEGRCTVTYEISLGRFFQKSFTATYYKKLAGATPGNNNSGSSNKSMRSVAYARNGHLPEAGAAAQLVSEGKIPQPVHNIKRTTRPLSKAEWKNFIKSYSE